MSRSTRNLASCLAAVALLGGSAVAPVAAAPEQPFYLDTVYGPVVTQTPERLLMIARINIPPGGYVDWHNHPGFTSVTVEGEGTFSLMSRNCSVQEFTDGDSFIPPRALHTARNFSDEWVTGVATFYVRGSKPTIMADARTDERLDARCGLAE